MDCVSLTKAPWRCPGHSDRSLTSAELSSLRTLSLSPPGDTFTPSHPHLSICRSCCLPLGRPAFLLLCAWLTQLQVHLCREGFPSISQPWSWLMVSFTVQAFTCTYMFTCLLSIRNRGTGSWHRLWLSCMNHCSLRQAFWEDSVITSTSWS